MARIAVRPEPFDEPRGLVEEGDVGIAKAVNRLLAVADHEDRRSERAGRDAESFAPALDELGDQLPLRAARVLQLVDEHVAVPTFEAVPALGEFVHVLQQPDRALEHTGKVEQRVPVERVLVLPQGHGEDAPHAARHDDIQVAPERPDRLGNRRRNRLGCLPMAPPRVLVVAVGRRKAGAREVLAARLAGLRQEVGAQSVDQRPERRLGGVAFPITDPARREAADVVGKHRELRMMDWAVLQEDVNAGVHIGEETAQPLGGPAAGEGRGEIPRSVLEVPPQRLRRHEASIEQRRDAAPQSPFPELRKDQRDIIIVAGDGAADAQRPIERFADQPRHLRVVGKVEPRIHVGLERKLANERQAEGIDGRDGDVSEAIVQVAPSGRVELREAARLLQPLDDPLTHLGGGFARERDGQNLVGLDARAQQVHVALDEHTRLPGPGGRFEDDVLRRVDRTTPGVLVGESPVWRRVRLPPTRVALRRATPKRGDGGKPDATDWFVRRHRRNPSGRPTRNCSSRIDAPCQAWAGTLRARSRRVRPRAAAAPRRGPWRDRRAT